MDKQPGRSCQWRLRVTPPGLVARRFVAERRSKMITQEHISAARNSDARPVHWFHGSSRGDGCDCSLRQRYLIAAAVGHVHWLGRIFHAETLGARRSRELDLPCARLGIGIGASLAIAAL